MAASSGKPAFIYRPAPAEVVEQRHTIRMAALADKAIGRSARFGRGIRLQQAASVPVTHKEARLLQQVEMQIGREMQRQKRVASPKLLRLLSVQRVLQHSLKLSEKSGGRKPTVYQLLGRISLTYGIDSRELWESATAMNTLWAQHPDRVSWDGTPKQAYNAIKMRIGRKNLPSSVVDLLHRRQIPLASSGISSALGIDFRKNHPTINGAMQLLETAGFVKKLPMVVLPGFGAPVSVWCHNAFRPSLSPYKMINAQGLHFRNVPMEILDKLLNSGGSSPMTQLYKETAHKPLGRRAGNPNAIYLDQAVFLNIKKLQDAGLVKTLAIPLQSRGKGTVKGTGTLKIELTVLGEKLWGDALKTGNLSEELRILLLGEKEARTPAPSSG